MSATISLDLRTVVGLWLHCQGLSRPRGAVRLTRPAFTGYLEQAGGLQVDTINVVDRAHYLTLWSRVGAYDRAQVDAWIYHDRVAYEYWGHEASVLPISHLPLGMRRMRRFPPPAWREASWWKHYRVSPAAKRRVLRRLRGEGPLESADFKGGQASTQSASGGVMPLPGEDKRALQLLWHAGRVAVRGRRHFRRVYDLAERVYPPGVTPADATAFEDSWLLIGLRGNGVASERHLVNYWTAPGLKAARRRRIINRNLKEGRIVEVRVDGQDGPFYALPEHMDSLGSVPQAQGTTLICPFDALLWQRRRAEDLLGFQYRVEIYVPPAKRTFGYYVLPILHDGRLVGRLDPKHHRSAGVLEIKAIYLEEAGLQHDVGFAAGLREAIASLASFLGAVELRLPSGWPAKLV